MDKKRQKIRKVVSHYKRMLEELGIHVEQTILFGSYAKKRESKESDIDLIIISEDFAKMNLRKRLEMLGIAAARIMKPIEAKGYTLKEVKQASKSSLLKEIIQEGIYL